MNTKEAQAPLPIGGMELDVRPRNLLFLALLLWCVLAEHEHARKSSETLADPLSCSPASDSNPCADTPENDATSPLRVSEFPLPACTPHLYLNDGPHHCVAGPHREVEVQHWNHSDPLFKFKLVERGMPVVLRDVPHLSEWHASSHWSLEYFAERLGWAQLDGVWKHDTANGGPSGAVFMHVNYSFLSTEELEFVSFCSLPTSTQLTVVNVRAVVRHTAAMAKVLRRGHEHADLHRSGLLKS